MSFVSLPFAPRVYSGAVQGARLGLREFVALALLGIAVAVAWPFLNPNAGAGEPRPVQLGSGPLDTPSASASSPVLSSWTVEAWALAGGGRIFFEEEQRLDIDFVGRPWEVRAQATITLPFPGQWVLLFEHEQPFTVTIDGVAYAVDGGGPGQQSRVVFQHEGGAAMVRVVSQAVDGRLRLRLLAVQPSP